MRTLSVMFMLFIGLGMSAQNNGIDRFYEKYQQDDHFTRINISSKMFSLFTNFDSNDPDEKDVLETISKLKGLKVLSGEAIPNAKAIYLDAVKRPNAEMEELMVVQDKGSELKFFITESKGIITELLLVSYDDTSVMMMSLIGDIDLKSISKLSKKMNIDGFEHLEKVK
jgi:hypothetical protein